MAVASELSASMPQGPQESDSMKFYSIFTHIIEMSWNISPKMTFVK